MRIDPDSLPFVDEHSVVVESPPGLTWDALLGVAAVQVRAERR